MFSFRLSLTPLQLAVLAPLACAQQGPPLSTESARCRIGQTIGSTLVIDGHRAYVEPQTFVSSDERLLLAGTPTFVWADSGAVALISGDSTIGAVMSAGGTAHSLRAPIAARLVNDVRAASAGRGRWAVMFAEAEPVRPQDTPLVSAYWFGITDGSRWTSLDRLAITGGPPRSIMASALTRTQRGFALAVPVARAGKQDVSVIEWDGSRLISQIVATGSAGYVSLASTAGGDLLLAVVRPDTTEREDVNSLFAYRRDAGTASWHVLPRLVRGGEEPVRDPSIDAIEDSILVTWRVTPTQSAAEARVIVTHSLGDGMSLPVTLGVAVEQALIGFSGRQPVWVLAAPASDSGARLRIVTRSHAGPVTLGDLASPFQRPIAAAWQGSQLRLVSGVAGRATGEPPVRSVVLSIDFRCGAAP